MTVTYILFIKLYSPVLQTELPEIYLIIPALLLGQKSNEL